MAIRYLQTASRLIVSKAGYDASPSLSDDAKLMDSDWGFSGLLIASGLATDPSSIALGDPTATTSTAPLIIPFASPGYVPSAYLYSEFDGSDYGFPNVGFNGIRQSFPVGRGNNDGNSDYSIIYDDRIELFRSYRLNTSYRTRWPNGVRYMVFGFSQ